MVVRSRSGEGGGKEVVEETVRWDWKEGLWESGALWRMGVPCKVGLVARLGEEVEGTRDRRCVGVCDEEVLMWAGAGVVGQAGSDGAGC